MDEQNQNIRPTKKQQELLVFIEEFIDEHGYSPSYREIMAGCNYTSVATVALHVNNLIQRGHLVKRDHNARSLEVVASAKQYMDETKPNNQHEAWLVGRVNEFVTALAHKEELEEADVANANVLIASLRILGCDEATLEPLVAAAAELGTDQT